MLKGRYKWSLVKWQKMMFSSWWLNVRQHLDIDLITNAGDPGSIPGSGRSPGEGNGNHSSILVWKIAWTEEPGRLQFMGSQRVGHDWVTNTHREFLRHSQPWQESLSNMNGLIMINFWIQWSVWFLNNYAPVSWKSARVSHMATTQSYHSASGLWNYILLVVSLPLVTHN